jgi:hypothetical protein
LPALQGKPDLEAWALFQLGWANYKMGHLEEAIQFNDRCLSIGGRFQEAARRNAEVFRSEYSVHHNGKE